MKLSYLLTIILFITILCLIPQITYSQQQTGIELDLLQVANSIIASLSAIGGAIAGGFFTYFATVKLEDRKNRIQKEEFERYRKALLKGIGEELMDYKKFLQENLELYQKDDNRFDGMRIGKKGYRVGGVIDTGFRPASGRTDIIRSYLKEINSPEYRIFNNTTFEQLFKSIEPELLVKVISAYRQFYQITDMMSSLISEISDSHDKEFPAHWDVNTTSIAIGVIISETLTRFYTTVDFVSNKILGLK